MRRGGLLPILPMPQNSQAAVFPHNRKGNNASLRFGRRIPIDISHHGDKGSSLCGSSNRNLFKKIAELADSTGVRKERFLNKEIAKISKRVPVLSSLALFKRSMILPRFDGHGNSKKERGPDGSKKERAPGVYGTIQKPGSGDDDPQRQECGADSARAWMQRSESAWMEEGVFEGTAAGAN